MESKGSKCFWYTFLNLCSPFHYFHDILDIIRILYMFYFPTIGGMELHVGLYLKLILTTFVGRIGQFKDFVITF